MTEAVEPKVGVVYVDRSHGDRFVIDALPADERVAELENGQWYELDGPDGLLAKLADGRVEASPWCDYCSGFCKGTDDCSFPAACKAGEVA